jgi:nucleotide-binding universal stress UspA family protein
MFKNILVPTDGSESSRDTIRRAVAFAKEIDAGITAFHAKPERQLPAYNEGSPAYLPSIADQAAQDIVATVASLCAEAGVACKTVVRKDGKVYRAILDAAGDYGCDLIFMASHGRSGIAAVLLGSETIKVLTHSKIPVLVSRS